MKDDAHDDLSTATGVLASISEHIKDLRKSERRVAHVVLDDPQAVLDMGVANLASRAEVSDPTVLRFCTALGYGGYRSFQIALAQSLAFGVPATNSAIRRTDASGTIVDKIFAYTLSSLDHTRRTLNVESVVRAIEMMAGATELVFCGHGASQIIAADAAQKFPLFGVPCSAPSDAHVQIMTAAMATSGTVFTLISNTGRTASILELAHTARDAGASVIAITGGPGPLAELSDHVVIVETHENTDVFTPTISRIAALVLVDVLSTGVALLRSDDHVHRMQEMKALLADIREERL